MINKIYFIITKVIHISLASICVMFLGIFVSKNLNALYPDNKKKKKNNKTLILHVCVFTALIYIFHYCIRNIMELLNDYLFKYIIFWHELIEYDANKLKALSGGIAMAFSMFLFMDKFKKELITLFDERVNIVILKKQKINKN